MTESMQPAQPDEMTQAWWDATREGRLLVQSCQACGHRQHPPRAVCTGCGSTEHLDDIESTGLGSVDACTVVERAPAEGLTPPYVVARVRLDEGVILLSNIETEAPYEVTIGDPVRLTWRDLADGRRLPIFEPAPEENR
ncbi:Zn-ribbon domain-containing OB-fold protein [Nocardioides sp.]|uniref:Zn-ribbon domain-containing OB-fold protein n=1 Tax=Nocardioides sp. TaxID=35761 RepID=UPI003561B2FA